MFYYLMMVLTPRLGLRQVEPVEWAYENFGETATKGQLSSMADYLARKVRVTYIVCHFIFDNAVSLMQSHYILK